MAEAKAVAYLELNVKGFEEALLVAKRALAVFGTAFAAFKTADFWVSHIRGAIDFGNAMWVASQRLGGFDPGKLLIIRKAFESTGLSAEEATSQIDEMIKSHRNFDTAFHGGKAGFGTALGTAQKNYGPEAGVLDKYAEQFARVEQTISSIFEKGQSFFLALSSGFLQPLYALLEVLNSIDLVGIGDSLGRGVGKVADTLIGLFSTGKLTDAFQEGLVVAARTFANYMGGAARFFADSLASILANTNWARLGAAISAVLIFAFNKAILVLAQSMIEVAKYFGAAIATVLEAVVNKLGLKLSTLLKVAAIAVSGPIAGFAAGKGVDAAFGGKALTPASFDQNLANVNRAFGPADRFNSLAQKGQQFGMDVSASFIPGSIGGNTAKFAPQDLFPGLTERSKKLGEALDSAAKAGEALGQIPSKAKLNFQALGPQEPLHIIADSLARVGGGGNYMRATLSIAEKEAMKQTEIQRQQLEVSKLIEKNTGETTRSPNGKINRG